MTAAVLTQQSMISSLMQRIVKTIQVLAELQGQDALEDQLQREKIVRTTILLCIDDAPKHETTENRLNAIVSEVIDLVALENAQNPPIEQAQ